MGTKRRRRTASNPLSMGSDGYDLRGQTEELPPEQVGLEGETEADLLTPLPVSGDVTAFSLPAIDSESPILALAASLTARRESLGLSLADVARASHMSPRTITRLEQEPLDKLDAPFYVKNRLRLYAGALRLDPDEVVDFFVEALRAQHATTTLSQGRLDVRTWLPWMVGGAVVVAVVVVVMINLW